MANLEVEKLDPPRVNVSMGFKRNVGNYESLNLSVSVTDSARQGETASAAFDRVYAFVEERLVEKLAEADKALKEGGLGGES